MQRGPIPIVALTANAFGSDIDKCRVAGMNAHVGKPFRTEALIVALADALQGKSAFQSIAVEPEAPTNEVPAVDWNWWWPGEQRQLSGQVSRVP